MTKTCKRAAWSFAIIGILVIGLAVASAEETNGVAKPPATSVNFSSDQLFQLMLAAVIGSLGTIGLLLGVDRVLPAFFRSRELQDKRYSADSIVKILPVVIYGITIILVVLAVMLLGLMRIVSAEGALGILASIVGYVLGKSSATSQQPQEKSSSNTPEVP